MWNTARLILFSGVLFLSFLGNESAAQTIQLGSGTTESSNYSSSPVNIYYRRTVCQFVYTADELAAANASTTDPISSLGFFVTESPIYTLRQYTIKLKHVTATDVAAPLTAPWTTVKTASNYSPTAGGYDMIAMDNPFTWDGVSSIGVEVCWSRVNPTYNASGKVRVYPRADGYRYSWSDANGSSCGSVPGTISTDKPQIQITFIPGTATNWTGAVSTDWFDSGNWSAGVPTKIMDAVIPNGMPRYPVITGSFATTKDISIAANASLTITNTDSLTVNGDWSNLGVFTPNNSTVIFEGESAAQNTVGGGPDQQFYTFEVNSVAGVNMTGGPYEVQGNLRLKGGVLNSNNLIKLISNASETGRLSEIRNICTYTLQMNDTFGDGWNGGYITIRIDGDVYGYFSASGTGSTASLNIPNTSTFTLEYTGGLFEGENSYSLVDPSMTTLTSDGPNPATGVRYTGTGNCGFSMPYAGNLAIQRYLNLSNDGWREMTSGGVSGQSLLNWQDDGLIMTNFTGSDYPGFGWTSVYTYEENNADGVKNDGWLEATNISNSLNPDNGHRIYIGTGTFTTEISGPPYAGSKTFLLDYQNSLPSETAASEDQKGWNLIGNPYPCSFNWNAIPASDKINVDDALWVWSGTAGNYGVYQGGDPSGTNDVGADVASSQAFWVHANATGGTLTLNEAQKTETDPVFVRSIEENDFVKIRLTGQPTSFYDEAVIAFKHDATDGYDERDKVKLFSYLPDAPSLSTVVNDETHLSINSLNTSGEAKSIALQADVGLTGIYHLDFENVDELSGTACLILEDLLLDSLVDLKAQSNYSFMADSTNNEVRFKLHISAYYNQNIWDKCLYAAGPTGINENHISLVSMYPNPANNSVNLQANEQILTLEITDLHGRLVHNRRVMAKQVNVDLSAYPNGIFTVKTVTAKGASVQKLEIIK